jgi:cytochrome c551/c552
MSWHHVIVSIVVGMLGVPTLVGAQSPSPAADATAGAALFRSRGCIECHAADVSRFQAERRGLFALAAAMWNHFPRMAERIRDANRGRPYLTSDEMRDLLAFLSPGDATRSGATEASLLGRTGDPGRGEQVVATKGCLACHSISAPAGTRAGALDELKGWESPWSIVAQMWNHSFLMQLETRGQGGAWAPLSDADMADLVAYLEQLMRRR